MMTIPENQMYSDILNFFNVSKVTIAYEIGQDWLVYTTVNKLTPKSRGSKW